MLHTSANEASNVYATPSSLPGIALLILLTWCLYSHIVVRVDAHIILLQTEGKPAGVNGLELVVILQVWPPP